MVKKVFIAILAVIILGIGGLVIHDKAKHTTNVSMTPGSNQSRPSASDVKILDYSSQGLTSVGSDIYSQTNATQLILSNNNLSSLPSQLGGMDKLQVLKVDHNRLQGALIAEIRKMPLVTLDASYNDMTGIPAEMGQLSTLKTLNYSYNKISTLPNEITNLKRLKTLDLTGNPLSLDQITRLKAALPDTTIVF